MIPSIKWFFAFTMLWSLGLVCLNYLVDPLQYYAKSEHPTFVLNQRYQIPGLVKNYNFDSVVIGTSMSENFLTSDIHKYLGLNSINLAVSGSSAAEQSRVVDLALNTGKPKTVVWELNYKSFSGENPNLISPGRFPFFLYSKRWNTHFYYLFSVDTLWMSVKRLLKNGTTQLEGLNSWYDREAYKFDGNHVIKHFCSRISSPNSVANHQFRQALEDNLFKYAQRFPQVAFFLFIPPQSIFNYALPGEIERFTQFRSELYAQARQWPNVTLVDFARDLELISDPYNYKDIEHFSLEVSRYILAALSQKKNTTSSDARTANDELTYHLQRLNLAEKYCQ